MAEEREALLKLPRREYLLTKEEKKRALIGVFFFQLILKLPSLMLNQIPPLA
jgi:hypothetical protein